MKKILYLNLLLSLLLLNCSSSLDESKILANYSDNKELKSIRTMEKKPDKTEADYSGLAIKYHDFANHSKNIDVTNLMIFKIKKIMDKYPDNTVVTAYYGSAYSMIGRDSANPVNKLTAVKKGISYIDKAVEMDKNNVYLRILRAEQARNLPSFFKRNKIAIKDYQFLTDGYERNKIKLEKNLISMIYLHKGGMLKKENKIKEAVTAWKKAVQADPDSDDAQQAKKMLSVYDEV